MEQGLIVKCLGLFLETFVHEDLAIMTGGVLVANDSLPVYLVFITLISGFLVGDIIIYGLGFGARKIPWIQRKFISSKVQNAREKLEKNLLSTLIFVRLLPGLLFPTYIACGFTGVAFGQFLITTMATAATYTAVLLTLLIKLGDAFIPTLGPWLWVILFATVLAPIAIRSIRKAKVAALSSDNKTYDFEISESAVEEQREIKGMPALNSVIRRVAVSEKIPQLVFYSPVAARWLLLGIKYKSLLLPTISNPLIEAGGLWGESKSRLLDQISGDQRKWISPYTIVEIRKEMTSDETLLATVNAINKAGFSFPLVVKPDIGWQGYGVRNIADEAELRVYLERYPKDSILIIQQLIRWDGEAGVFYSRLPGEEHGRVISLTLRYYPHVIGNGESTVSQLISYGERTRFKLRFYRGKDNYHSGLSEEKLNYVPAKGEVFRLAFIGSIRVGGLYRNGSEYITKALQDRFDAIGKSMPEFYFGRFDIKFNTIERLMNGEDFSIFEVNGAGAEAIHVWDASTPLRTMYRELFRFQSIMFEISSLNRMRGFKPMPPGEFFRFTRKYNSLISSYPSSE